MTEPVKDEVAEVIKYLTFVAKKDAERGGSGYRTTTEVAEYLRVSTVRARRRLHGMEAAGLVEGYLDGNVIVWRVAAPPAVPSEP